MIGKGAGKSGKSYTENGIRVRLMKRHRELVT